MSDYDRPKNTKEMLIEQYTGTAPKKVEVEKVKETVKESATDSREADVVSMLQELAGAHAAIRRAGKEINQLPTDISRRLFQKYENVDRAMLALEKELQGLMG